jgi:hypothetical protein
MKRVNPEQPRNYSIIKNAGKFMDMVIAILVNKTTFNLNMCYYLFKYNNLCIAKMAQQSRDHIM